MTTTKVEPRSLLGDPPNDSTKDPVDDAMALHTLTTAERILAVMAEIGNVPKDDYNSSQQFHYRSVEKVVAATRDAMIKFRLLCLPKAVQVFTDYKKPETTRTATLKIVYEFMSADDQDDTIEVEVAAEANDNGDKAVSKAMTAAHKAVLLQSFQIGDSGTDQDTGNDGGDEPEFADEPTIEIIVAAIGALTEGSQKILRAAWSPSWGSVSRHRVPLTALEPIWALLAALAEQEASEIVTSGS